MRGIAQRLAVLECASAPQLVIMIGPIDLETGQRLGPCVPVIPQDPNGPIDYRRCVAPLAPKDSEVME